MSYCEKMKKELAEYLEGTMTDKERKVIEDHLKACERCRGVLSDLKKTQEILGNLKKMEPPPWFVQKTMARVREEAQQGKSLFHRLFHPFYIKIPIEALAACLVAVLAFHLYKASVPEMRLLETGRPTVPAVPGTPVVKEPEKTPPVVREKASQNKAGPDGGKGGKGRESMPSPSVSSGAVSGGPKDQKEGRDFSTGVVESRVREEAGRRVAGAGPEAEKKLETRMKAGAPAARMEAPAARPSPAAPSPPPQPPSSLSPAPPLPAASAPAPLLPAAQSPPATSAKRAGKSSATKALNIRPSETDSMVSLEESRAVERKADTTQLTLQLSARDAKKAPEDAEKLLLRFSGEKIGKESRAGMKILTASLPAGKVEEFVDALKTLGEVKRADLHRGPLMGGAIGIRLEIRDNP